MKLDRDDRAALARLGVYAGLGCLALVTLVLLALACGLAVRAFLWAV